MTSTLKTEKIQFRGDNSDAITLASSGKVGIGTTSPSETLHVKGFARIESNAGDAAYMRFVNDVNSGGKIWRAGAGVSAHGTFSIYNQTDNKFGINVHSNGYVNKPNQPAFFAGFSENSYDESKYAKQISKILGTDHYDTVLSPKDTLSIIPNLMNIYDEPFSDSSQIPTFAPKLALQRAVLTPPEPPPITKRSKSNVFCMGPLLGFLLLAGEYTLFKLP